MPAINEIVINGAALNGGDSLSLPATVEEICIACQAFWEQPIAGFTAAVWQLLFTDLTASWQLSFDAKIEEC